MIEKIKWLNEQLRIPLYVIAQYAHCHPTSIANYISGKGFPTKRIESMLNNAINAIVKEINEKMGEE